MAPRSLTIDPAHAAFDIFSQPITQDIWRDKYSLKNEKHPFDSMDRVVKGVYRDDHNKDAQQEALEAMKLGLWNPGGRIHAGAGTDKRVTLINCYVMRTMHDSMDGIADTLKDTMLTMQQGGGIGVDFSTLRPEGAILRRTGEGAQASGPLPFADMWDAMCNTIMSAGARRGAMMATLACWHPDIIKFINAKTTKGRLTKFNISVLITDEFMIAVRDDASWKLRFTEPRADNKHVQTYQGASGETWYVYQELPARELWDLIIKTTYVYSEPGIIFIDRVNKTNNLQYCETISCTNPCGEQPLPPYGACDLGSINLARLVLNPFTHSAAIDWHTLKVVVQIGVRFLDNVLDVTQYPLSEQRVESMHKRRLGLGITGLGDALIEHRLRYGSREAIELTKVIMRFIALNAYKASALLAKERGAFLSYIEAAVCEAPFLTQMDESAIELIRAHGLRNGVLLTIAPTGTTSIYYGNVSSGLEPVFTPSMKRKVLQADGSYQEYTVLDYAAGLWFSLHPEQILPDYYVTTKDLKVEDHVRMQAACQMHVDASISKTINCPEDMTFKEFKSVYDLAYKLGCKSTTTYRPSDVRGSILEDATKELKTVSSEGGKQLVLKDAQPVLAPRPTILSGSTYKLKWPSLDAALYLTINDNEGKPYEVFISSKAAHLAEWTMALTRMISAVLRKGGDTDFIGEELSQIRSSHDAAWIEGKYYGSLVAYIGAVIDAHVRKDPSLLIGPGRKIVLKDEGNVDWDRPLKLHPLDPHQVCPKCGSPTLRHLEGCSTCDSCGYSSCT